MISEQQTDLHLCKATQSCCQSHRRTATTRHRLEQSSTPVLAVQVPKDWANAAGFGGGASIFLSENIVGEITYRSKMPFINSGRMRPTYTHVEPSSRSHRDWGGKSRKLRLLYGGRGKYSGVPSSGNLSNPSKNNTNSGPTATAYDAFIVSTPREDGAIIHVVGDGQSLIGIAKAYDVPLNEILALNNFHLIRSFIPNEEIIIQVGNPPTATISPTATRPTATASVTATQKHTHTERNFYTQPNSIPHGYSYTNTNPNGPRTVGNRGGGYGLNHLSCGYCQWLVSWESQRSLKLVNPLARHFPLFPHGCKIF